MQAHELFSEDRCNAFQCDLTADDLTLNVNALSVDFVTALFVFSAMSPERMEAAVANLAKVRQTVTGSVPQPGMPAVLTASAAAVADPVRRWSRQEARCFFATTASMTTPSYDSRFVACPRLVVSWLLFGGVFTLLTPVPHCFVARSQDCRQLLRAARRDTGVLLPDGGGSAVVCSARLRQCLCGVCQPANGEQEGEPVGAAGLCAGSVCQAVKGQRSLSFPLDYYYPGSEFKGWPPAAQSPESANRLCGPTNHESCTAIAVSCHDMLFLGGLENEVAWSPLRPWTTSSRRHLQATTSSCW